MADHHVTFLASVAGGNRTAQNNAPPTAGTISRPRIVALLSLVVPQRSAGAGSPASGGCIVPIRGRKAARACGGKRCQCRHRTGTPKHRFRTQATSRGTGGTGTPNHSTRSHGHRHAAAWMVLDRHDLPYVHRPVTVANNHNLPGGHLWLRAFSAHTGICRHNASLPPDQRPARARP